MDERTPLVRPSGRPVEDPETLSEAKAETRSGVDMVFFVIAVLGKTFFHSTRRYSNEKTNMNMIRCISCYW